MVLGWPRRPARRWPRTGGIAVAKGGGRQAEGESRCALSRFKATVSRRPVIGDGSAPGNASASGDVAALGPPGFLPDRTYLPADAPSRAGESSAAVVLSLGPSPGQGGA